MTTRLNVIVFTEGGYSIHVNDKLFIQTTNPIISLKSAIDTISTLFGNVVVSYEDTSGNDVGQEQLNKYKTNVNMTLDNVDIDALNQKIGFTAKTGAYKETFKSTIEETEEDTKTINHDEIPVDKNTTNIPVGDVECPEVGDLIYVDGMQGLLSTINGGVVTVSMVFKSTDSIVVDEIEHDISYYNDYEDEYVEDTDIEEITEDNILVEVEEFPGTYFSWSLLRKQQNELQQKYGYKPACKVF
jgi:hypothetical protein